MSNGNPGTGTLSYFLTDHLGSIVTVLDKNGAPVSQQRYLPFGQVRSDVGKISQTDFGYTGQRNMDVQGNSLPLGLMDYNARFYDPYITHFSQPDSIIPDQYNPQDLNRYAYVGNNPINGTDPTGHSGCSDIPIDSPARASCDASGNLDEYGVTLSGWTTSGAVNEIKSEVQQISNKLESAYGSYCSNPYYSSHVNCPVLGPSDLFHTVMGDLTIKYDPNHPTGPCDSMTPGAIICGSLAEEPYGSGTFLGPDPLAQGLHQITHEFGHQFDRAIQGVGSGVLGRSTIITPGGDYVSGVTGGNYVRSPNGYAHGGNMPGVSHIIDNNNSNCYGGSPCEDFADMFMNWTWNSFDSGTMGAARYGWMDSYMGSWIALAVSEP